MIFIYFFIYKYKIASEQKKTIVINKHSCFRCRRNNHSIIIEIVKQIIIVILLPLFMAHSSVICDESKSETISKLKFNFKLLFKYTQIKVGQKFSAG